MGGSAPEDGFGAHTGGPHSASQDGLMPTPRVLKCAGTGTRAKPRTWRQKGRRSSKLAGRGGARCVCVCVLHSARPQAVCPQCCGGRGVLHAAGTMHNGCSLVYCKIVAVLDSLTGVTRALAVARVIMVVHYNPKSKGLATIFDVNNKGTVFGLLVTCKTAYLLVSMFVFLATAQHNRDIISEDTLNDLKAVAKPLQSIVQGQWGFLFVFITTFYLNQCYQRYQHFTALAWTGWGNVFSTTEICVAHFGPGSKVTSDIARYMNAAHHMLYLQIELDVSDTQWEILRMRRLLTKDEFEFLQSGEFKGSKWRLIVLWAQRRLHLARENGEHGCTDHEISVVEDHIRAFKEALGQMFDIDDLPVPYPYFHLLKLISTTYVFLYAFAFAFEPYSWMHAVPVPLVMLGIDLVSQDLSNPLGSDNGDLPVNELERITCAASSFWQALPCRSL